MVYEGKHSLQIILSLISLLKQLLLKILLNN